MLNCKCLNTPLSDRYVQSSLQQFMGQMASKTEQLTKSDIRNTRKSILLFCDISEDGSSITLSQEALDLCAGDQELIDYLNAVIKTIPNHDNPKLLSDFNYEYRNGKLVNSISGGPFHWVNQAHYDALGDIIYRHIQKLMVSDFGLEEVHLPLKEDCRREVTEPDGTVTTLEYTGPWNNIFVSPDWQTCERLMLIIQGSGAVRAGQWARALCINNTLEMGSILPYLKKCKELGFGVIVFNPNLNYDFVTPPTIARSSFLTTSKTTPKLPERVKIRYNSNSHRHVVYVWDRFVSRAKAKVVTAVAHSAGGDASVALIRHRADEVKARLAGIAFTDSVHMISRREDDVVKQFVQKRCRNWVTSKEPLDTKLVKASNDCLRVSAGHDTHEFTSGVAIESVFAYLLKRIELFLAGEDIADGVYDGMDDEMEVNDS